ncbi:MAG: potassium channel family protein [Bacteroidetes bacterium]|nr:potassium channel family protein [Bacteroidota bacterium]
MTILTDNKFVKLVTHKFMQRLFFAVLLFGFATCTGIVGYIILEGYTMNEAFYMTIITISTVGFGEVHPLSEKGRLFTALLIILNIGVLTYTVSVISAFIFEGDLKSVIKENQMTAEIERLKDHIIVCGYGRLGRMVCTDLTKSGKDILIVENNKDSMDELISKDKICLEGDATDDEVILQMGITNADTIITTFHSDASNIFVVLAARELNKEIRIISRASSEANISKLKLAGANHVIIPEDIGGSFIAAMVRGKEHVEMGKWGY